MAHDEQKHHGHAAGTLAAVAAFMMWGVFPIYWKGLQGVAPLELIAHRVVWSLLFLIVVIVVRGRWRAFGEALTTPRLAGLYLVSGVLLSINWLTFVWAVLAGRIVETSLGYFLNPLLSVALGRLVLREALRPGQMVALALATAGVLLQVVQMGRLPWVALVLATSFAFYGLLRKRGPLGALTGLGVETALLAPAAAGFLIWVHANGGGALGHVAAWQQVLVLGAGVVTAVPLLLFAAGARALPLSTVGFLQYLAPSLQFVIGVAVYHEPFGGSRAMSFVLIWVGLAVFAFDGVRAGRRAAVCAGSVGAAGPEADGGR